MVRNKKINKTAAAALSALLFLSACGTLKTGRVALYAPIDDFLSVTDSVNDVVAEDSAVKKDTATAYYHPEEKEENKAKTSQPQQVIYINKYQVFNGGSSAEQQPPVSAPQKTVQKTDTAKKALKVNQLVQSSFSSANKETGNAEVKADSAKRIVPAAVHQNAVVAPDTLKKKSLAPPAANNSAARMTTAAAATTAATSQNDELTVLHRQFQAKSDSIRIISEQLNRLKTAQQQQSAASSGVANNRNTAASSSSFSEENARLQSQLNQLTAQNQQIRQSVQNLQSSVERNASQANNAQQAQMMREILGTAMMVSAAASQNSQKEKTPAAAPVKTVVVRDTVFKTDTIFKPYTKIKTDTVIRVKTVENPATQQGLNAMQDSLAHLQGLMARKTDSISAMQQKIEKQVRYDSVKVTAFYRSGSLVAIDEGKVIESATSAIKGKNLHKITLTGYTDRSGSAELNLRLSNQRVARLTERLIQAGIHRELIFSQYYGSKFASPTVVENERKVEILIVVN